ncbi:DUF1501 domain-containing protein [soil metagenome]
MAKLSRREFLMMSALATSTLLIPKFLTPLQAKEIKELLGDDINRKLVIIQLSGGNDGLNTIIPYNNDIYYQGRESISVAKNNVLKINDELGFNPGMSKLKELYDNGYVSVINSVGYPNPNRSHFRSMDIWQTASDSEAYLNSGWIGRYLDSECSDCKNPYNAIEVNDSLSLAMKGNKYNGLAVEDPQKFFLSSTENFFTDIAGISNSKKDDHDNVSYLYKTVAEATSSANYVYKTSKIYKSKSDYPKGQFSQNLKTIAELIISNIDSRVFYISLSGFDTHVNQNSRQNALLKELSDGIHSFTTDLKQNNRLNDTLVMTFSEFGRRVSQNASNGTDHGTANNIFMINGQLKKPGFYNSAPDLTDLDNGDLKYKIDFRTVYANVLNKWLGADDGKILGQKFKSLDIV